MQDYATQIHDLFEDDSFPPIVAFSGKWGIGKTFYVQNHLTTELVTKYDKKVHYLSLMGITSIEDFKDLLVSKVYLEEKHDNTATTKLFDLFSSVEKHIGGNNTISSVIKGSTGAVKHYMLKNIDDEIFIIDDIERLEDKSLKKAILGECLNLSEKSEDKKNKFLFVTDLDTLKIEQTYTEKIFSEVISFNPTPEDLFEILQESLYHLKDKRPEIIHQIDSKNLTNLRVLSRLFKRSEALFSEFSSDYELDLDVIKNNIIEDSFKVAKLFYIDNKTTTEISQPANKHESIQLKVRHSFLLNEDFINYFTGSYVDIKNILDHENLPLKGKPLDKLLYQEPYRLSETDFSEGIRELKTYILNEKEVHLKKFFECCYYHEYLVSNGYIEQDKDIEYNQISKIADQKKFHNSPKFHNLTLSDERYKNLCEAYIGKFRYITNQDELDKLFSSMENSFANCELYVGNSYKLRPILNEFSEKDWRTLFNNWTSEDIGCFGYYLFTRYEINESKKRFEKEKGTIRFLKNLIDELLETEPTGLKKGLLHYLNKALEHSQDVLNN